ncbi:MBL fold metallo-hydrolase [Aliikangiella sp. G2MR2-5]|uniref:MBL fold metallo-hydrolase n=1 Tax=Aliikangiella sp. G2MR2-5 TaxID=2788943 RepID=UPI0018AAE151|nr:MBL fold metallo-hydrolase [Aliikangiella sp. G2MR2-5]
MHPVVETFFDKPTFSFTHLVYCPKSKKAAVIDPVMDFDPAAMRTSTCSIEKIYQRIQALALDLCWVIETHAHADHLSAAQWLKSKFDAPIVIGEHITEVQKTFNELFELEGAAEASADDFDHLAKDGDRLTLGELEIEVMHTPGHTPTCCTYVIGNTAFVGDTIFMPDFGTARCDFPGGDARQLYRSLQRTLSLADDTRLLMCHDYMPGGRDLKWESSVAEQKRDNIHINSSVDEDSFVKMRRERDQQLPVPKLILPALQVNIRAGKMPLASASGTHFIRLPLNKL